MTLRYFPLIICFFLSLHALAANTEFGEDLARQGVGSASGSLSGLDAEESLGVSVSGGKSNSGRNINVDYSQVLNGQMKCPATTGETGRFSSMQQFVTACEAETSSSRKLWICVPHDQNDTMTSECEDGEWKTVSVPKNDSDWKNIETGLSIKIVSCEEEDCEYRLKVSNNFSGGEEKATTDGEGQLSSSKGVTETVNNQGAYLPDGTVLQPGSNENSGDIVGGMMESASVAACTDDVKVSIAEGTPVLTCDGQQDVGTFGDGEECEDETQCDNWETETDEYTKVCDDSIDYENAECEVEFETKTCQLENAKTREECTTENSATHAQTLKEVETCVSLNHQLHPYGSSSVKLPKHFLGEKIFVGIYYTRKGNWGGSSTTFKQKALTTKASSSSIKIKSYNRSGWSYQVRIGGRKLYQNNIMEGNTVHASVDVCLKPNTSKLIHYDRFSMCWSCNSPYQNEKTSGFFLERSKYLKIPDNSGIGDSPVELKSKYKNQGFKIFKNLDLSTYKSQYIIYRNNETKQSCELVND